MDPQKPLPGAKSFSLVEGEKSSSVPGIDWPHAPVHRLSEHGVYIVTGGTLHKEHFFKADDDRSALQGLLFSLAKKYNWQLEAWAVLSNHYHFVARGNPLSENLGELIRHFHSQSARDLNSKQSQPDRKVWHNFWDTKLTYQYAYFARLNYVHQNPVKHRLVPVANQYRWCSARWFERVASPAQV